ncbi:MAG: L-lactate permease [Syntrophales bacterium]|nr:L-lactate permease [Syntrophales bacterium]
MAATELPITVLSWTVSSLPILALLLLLIWRRWSTSSAAPAALAIGAVSAIALFHTPLRTMAVAAGKGIWDAIFILYVIWPALILYNTVEKARAFIAIQQGIRKLLPDRLLVVLAFAWVLSSFIQGIAGFGTPIAITSPLLVGLGVKPVYAVVLPLIGAAWANMYGTLGAGWFATLAVVDIPNRELLFLYSGLLIWIPNLAGGLTIAWMYGRLWALKRGFPAIAVISLLHGGLQIILLPFITPLAVFFASAAALGATFLLGRWSFYRQHDEDEPDRVFTEESKRAAREEEERFHGGRKDDSAGEDKKETGLSLAAALAPYAFLAAISIIALMIPFIRDFLEQVRVGLPFPETTTEYGVYNEATDAYSSFTPLTHPGTLLLLSALAGYLLFRKKKAYPPEFTPGAIILSASQDALPATTAITALLLISKVMDHSGQIIILALGVAHVAPTMAYVGASNFIGLIGSLITSSNTASNVLFAPLQATAAQAEGIQVELALAGQFAGGATGNAISPGDALLGAAVTGISERLGVILARALPWSIMTACIISAATMLIYVLS